MHFYLQSSNVPVVQNPHMAHLHPLLSYSPEAFSPQRASPGFSPDTGTQRRISFPLHIHPHLPFLLRQKTESQVVLQVYPGALTPPATPSPLEEWLNSHTLLDGCE